MRQGQELGPFTIEKEIGSGAMGVVYRGRYSTNGKPVAIKMISGGHDANPMALARFEREAEILKKLRHPNIVRLYATGRDRETPFYVMEYVDGDSLETLLERRGRFTWEEVVALGLQVCESLKHAHGQGIVHRDLKPANIMMTPSGVVKLTDFGIAKGLESVHLTSTNCTVGTASYMSPEQCRGEPDLTYKSDLYSLGVVFYELLTGKRPFVADTTLKLFLAHTEGTFERPSRQVMDIPIWLDTLVCQLMEKDAAKRPLDAAMVARALNDITEKVAAQRSAGVEVVTARRMDVPKSRRPKDEADREAARTLRDAATKKKSKRKTKPLYERAWVQAIGISLVLAAVAAIVWFVLQPPAPEQLFEQARAYMNSDNPDEWDKARHGPIASYLKHYGDRGDEQAAQVQAWADQADIALKEKQLQARMRAQLQPQDEAEAAAQNATRAEEAGDLASAAQRWEPLLVHKQDTEGELRPWGLLAEKRLSEIKRAEQRETEIRTMLTRSRERDKEVQSGSGAVYAIRAEVFGDPALALLQWRRIKPILGADDETRVDRLLAARKIAELDGNVPRGQEAAVARQENLKAKLDAAAELVNDEPREARAICRDVIALYGPLGDSELKVHVERAKSLLGEVMP